MKTLYIECNMGAAGDMLMSALYDLLDDKAAFLAQMNNLGLPNVRLAAEKRTTCGIVGTHMHVYINGEEEKTDCSAEYDSVCHVHEHEHEHEHEHDHDHDHDHNHHHDHDHDHHHDHDHDHHHDHDHGHHHHAHATPGSIAAIINTLPLPDSVKSHARAVYDAIAQAESHAHGLPVSDVHYHEVGALDAVADVTGVCYALYLLNPDQIIVSPIHVGSGTVRCAHGVMPVPAPATAFLLQGIPCYGGNIQGELCTPTGAALLSHFADSFGPMPQMCTEKTGFGVGTKEFEQANCVRTFLGETGRPVNSSGPNGEIVELVCNLDDTTGEALAHAAHRLLELGALDVYTTPGTMKKGRPGQVLTVLCNPDQQDMLAQRILMETSSNGVRVRHCDKYFLTPTVAKVQTPWGAVRMKLAEGFGIRRCKPEADDVAALARENNVSFRDVWDAAMHITCED